MKPKFLILALMIFAGSIASAAYDFSDTAQLTTAGSLPRYSLYLDCRATPPTDAVVDVELYLDPEPTSTAALLVVGALFEDGVKNKKLAPAVSSPSTGGYVESTNRYELTFSHRIAKGRHDSPFPRDGTLKDKTDGKIYKLECACLFAVGC